MEPFVATACSIRRHPAPGQVRGQSQLWYVWFLISNKKRFWGGEKNGDNFATCTLLGLGSSRILGILIFVPKISPTTHVIGILGTSWSIKTVGFCWTHMDRKQEHRQGCLMANSGSIFWTSTEETMHRQLKIKQFGWILTNMRMPPVSINPFVALHPSAGVAMRVSFDLIWCCWRSTVRYSWTSLSPQPLDLTLASKSLLGCRITPCIQEDWQRFRTLASL